MRPQRRSAFTLVEIMIVVGILGILVAVAIPSFKRVRAQTIARTMLNDGRQIGAAAQKYFLEQGTRSVVISIDPDTGAVNGPISVYITNTSAALDLSGSPVTLDEGTNFALTHSMGTVSFDDRGKVTEATGPIANYIPGFAD